MDNYELDTLRTKLLSDGYTVKYLDHVYARGFLVDGEAGVEFELRRLDLTTKLTDILVAH
ncbi:hypothetical protein LCGC14_0538730 [marine sediment metagenome]|uniref:Uncharacterized protein n=1 Tax=marine sediment metagenome TaxID=412755 RepID=A0A0F9V1R0_9ZZZZ